MAEDALIAGAAAPAGTRRIRSAAILDSIWSLIVSAAIAVSSVFPLVDLPTSYVRTRDVPLRVYVILLPAAVLVVAIVAIVRRSTLLAAVATGTLVPAVALCGSLGGALFLDAASPFTDAGVPLAVGAGLMGVVMIVRWFVYVPPPVVGRDSRPPSTSARVLLGLGSVLAANVLIRALRDDPTWSASFVVATGFMLLTPVVVVAAALTRSVVANAVAAAACLAQVVAVLAARVDESELEVASTLALRTGVVGVIALAVAAGVAIVGVRTADVGDELGGNELPTDDADWRWTIDDDL